MKQLLLVLLLFALAVNGASTLYINVSSEGTNDDSCLNGTNDCLTLDHALTVLEQVHNDVTVTIAEDQTLESPHKYDSVTNLVLIGLNGEEAIEINCTGRDVGLYLSHSIDITISFIKWINCGIKHPTSALGNWSSHDDKLILPSAYSAVFLFNCTNFKLSHTYFSSTHGSGVSLYNVLGNVTIEHSEFVNHTLSDPCDTETIDPANCSPQSTGLYIEFSYCQNMTSYCTPDTFRINNNYSMFHIYNCTFEGNDNPGAYRNVTDVPPVAGLSREQHWPFGRGGGMAAIFRSFEFKWFTMIIEETRFLDNVAVYGGGLYLKLEAGFADHWRFGIVNATFDGNEAKLNGGGLEMDVNIIYLSKASLNKKMRNHIVVIDSNFMGNTAKWGGGTSLVAYPGNVSYMEVQFNRSSWQRNVYTSGAGAVGLLRKEKPEQSYIFITSVMFTDCSFVETKPILAYQKSLRLLSSTVYTEGLPLEFYGRTCFDNNGATALSLSDTGATLFGKVRFLNNSAFNGGGLLLSGKAYITLSYMSVIEFVNNSAYECGGAIYYMAPGPLEMDTSGSCFVWYHQAYQYDVPLRYWRINVTFIGNTAMQSGDTAFISDPQKCVWPNELPLFDPERMEKFDFSGQRKNTTSYVVSTPIKKMEIDYSDNNSSDYNVGNESKTLLVYEMMPGEGLGLTINTYDDFDQLVPVVMSIQCHRYEDYMSSNFSVDYCRSNSTYFAINDNRLFESNTPLDHLVIGGPEDCDELVLLFRTCQPVSVVLPLRIKFKSCSLGYHYDEVDHVCMCITNNPSVMLCVLNTTNSISKPCLRHQYWMGKLPQHNDSLVYQFCHTGKCTYDKSGKTCGEHPGYYPLEVSCINNLVGSLCSSCKNGSLTYNSYSCSECTLGDSVGLVLLMFTGCFIVVGVILVFLKLNIRVSTAGFYGFLYFYSVLELFLWIDMSLGLEVSIAIITGIASLDFIILQYFELCLFEGVHAIHYEVLHYIYPLTVVFLIVFIIKMDKWCLRKVQFFKGNAAVQALCIILLISYTSVSQTSLRILLPLTYQNATSGEEVEQRYVYIDPDVKYLDPKLHLPYWLIALVFEACFVLPFAFIMILSPWLMRCINISRIKPLLDEYQNCFHDNYRWFAGVYLLARQVLFLISMISTNPNEISYFQQLFCLFLLILVATLQPYRIKIFNYIDIFFLSILTLISMSGYNATVDSLLHSPDGHQALLGVLSLLPFISVVIGCIFLLVRKIGRRIFKNSSSTRLHHVLGNLSDSFSQASTGSLEDVRYTTGTYTDRQSDLPPRFYEEEDNYRQDEQTRLIQHRKGRAVFTATRYNTLQPSAPSINAPHTN